MKEHILRVNSWILCISTILIGTETLVIVFKAPPLLPSWIAWAWNAVLAINLFTRWLLRRDTEKRAVAEAESVADEYLRALLLNRTSGALTREQADRAIHAVCRNTNSLVAAF